MTEHQIQSAFIEWVRLAEKQDDRLKLLFAVPNGGKRSILTALKLKKEGVKPGVPDIMLPLKNGAYNGLAIEFKHPKTGKFSKNQVDYMARLLAQNWRVVCCTSAEEAIDITKNYLND